MSVSNHAGSYRQYRHARRTQARETVGDRQTDTRTDSLQNWRKINCTVPVDERAYGIKLASNLRAAASAAALAGLGFYQLNDIHEGDGTT